MFDEGSLMRVNKEIMYLGRNARHNTKTSIYNIYKALLRLIRILIQTLHFIEKFNITFIEKFKSI